MDDRHHGVNLWDNERHATEYLARADAIRTDEKARPPFSSGYPPCRRACSIWEAATDVCCRSRRGHVPRKKPSRSTFLRRCCRGSRRGSGDAGRPHGCARPGRDVALTLGQFDAVVSASRLTTSHTIGSGRATERCSHTFVCGALLQLLEHVASRNDASTIGSWKTLNVRPADEDVSRRAPRRAHAARMAVRHRVRLTLTVIGNGGSWRCWSAREVSLRPSTGLSSVVDLFCFR